MRTLWLCSPQDILSQTYHLCTSFDISTFLCSPGKLSSKTVTWNGGSYVFFQTIMDSELVKYMQPFFVEDTQYWFKRLRKKPVPPLFVDFVDGMILHQVRECRLHWHNLGNLQCKVVHQQGLMKNLLAHAPKFARDLKQAHLGPQWRTNAAVPLNLLDDYIGDLQQYYNTAVSELIGYQSLGIVDFWFKNVWERTLSLNFLRNYYYFCCRNTSFQNLWSKKCWTRCKR